MIILYYRESIKYNFFQQAKHQQLMCILLHHKILEGAINCNSMSENNLYWY